MSRVILPSILLLLVVSLNGAPMVKIGNHPTAVLTTSGLIHTLEAYNGRIYMGYGNYEGYPAVVIVAYDPVANQFRLEESASSDSIAYFRTIDGKLYAPHVDPIHYEDFRDFSYLDPTLSPPGWRDQTPRGCYHVYDFTKSGTALYFSGSSDGHEGGGSGGGLLMKSVDSGATWSIARVSTVGRYYWCFPHGGRVYVQDGYYNGTTFTAGATFSSYASLYKPTNVGTGTGGVEYVVAVQDRSVGSYIPTATNLLRFNGSTVSTLVTGVYDFAFDGTRLFVLTSGGAITVSNNITATTPTFSNLPITGLPAGAYTLGILNGIAYVGTGTTELWAARTDGTSLVVSTPTLLNLLPDSFGRGLACDANRLLVGAPDATAAIPLAGRAELFEEPAEGPWTSSATFDPPAPDFSGWFGKDVALKGDLMAIVETGYDTTNNDRGRNARVHVTQQSGGSWTSRAILSIPFAQTVAIDDRFLFVGTANPFLAQDGQPAIYPYRINRDAAGIVTLTAATQLTQFSTAYGYQPVARVAVAGDLLVGGFAGDPSRGGGPGIVAIYRRNAAGTSYSSAGPPLQLSSPADFGYSISFDGQWLAVGAPREDTAAPQAGAVYLYENTGAAAPFVLRQSIVSPLAQNEAIFGAAVAVKHGVLLVGSPGATVGGQRRKGKTYRYLLNGSQWVSDGELPLPAGSLAEFGIEVAIGETILAAGSRYAQSGTLTERVSIVANPKPFTGIDLWAESNGLVNAEPPTDLEGDGLTELHEYAFNLHPTVPDAGVQAGAAPLAGQPQIVAGPSGLEFQFVRPVNDARLTTQVETSVDFELWEPLLTPLTIIATVGNYQLCSVPLPIAPAQIFARLRILYNRH
ncbi:MAG TPA: FG-GAP repeat protein [Chthoniobacteraceae bacterium]|nr:FG-GAP repeat protein [Chthoniobacteraceae bacterium]